MEISFYELDKAKRAAKALMYAKGAKESDFTILVRGSVELKGDPVFRGIDLKYNGIHWIADIDGKAYKESQFKIANDADFYLIMF